MCSIIQDHAALKKNGANINMRTHAQQQYLKSKKNVLRPMKWTSDACMKRYQKLQEASASFANDPDRDMDQCRIMNYWLMNDHQIIHLCGLHRAQLREIGDSIKEKEDLLFLFWFRMKSAASYRDC